MIPTQATALLLPIAIIRHPQTAMNRLTVPTVVLTVPPQPPIIPLTTKFLPIIIAMLTATVFLITILLAMNLPTMILPIKTMVIYSPAKILQEIIIPQVQMMPTMKQILPIIMAIILKQTKIMKQAILLLRWKEMTMKIMIGEQLTMLPV